MSSRLRTIAAPATAVLSLSAVGAFALPANASAGFTHRRVPTSAAPHATAHALRPADDPSPSGDPSPTPSDGPECGNALQRQALRAHGLQSHAEAPAADYGCGKVEVKVTNSQTGQPISGVTYALCEEPPDASDQSARPNGARTTEDGCPGQSTLVATSNTQSNDDGYAFFFFVTVPCPVTRYVVYPTDQPAGYEPGRASADFSIPGDDGTDGTTDYCDREGGDSQTPYEEDVTLTPTPPAPQPAPTARDDSSTTSEGNAVTIDVLANDSPATSGSTISITDVGTPSDGTATTTGSAPQDAHAKKAAAASSQEVRYTPKAGFVGTDRFPYTITDSSDGQTSTANVSVRVTAVKAVATPTPTPSPTVKPTHKARSVTKATKHTKTTTASAATLPFTGAPVTTELTWGAALVLIGGWLTMAGARRRRTQR